jgi:DNA-binding response OmpR family regulator
MISGNEQATEEFYLYRIGADDFMKKPFSRAEVFARIERPAGSGRRAAPHRHHGETRSPTRRCPQPDPPHPRRLPAGNWHMDVPTPARRRREGGAPVKSTHFAGARRIGAGSPVSDLHYRCSPS